MTTLKQRLPIAALAATPIVAGYFYSEYRRQEWLKAGIPGPVPGNGPLYLGMATGVGFLFFKGW